MNKLIALLFQTKALLIQFYLPLVTSHYLLLVTSHLFLLSSPQVLIFPQALHQHHSQWWVIPSHLPTGLGPLDPYSTSEMLHHLGQAWVSEWYTNLIAKQPTSTPVSLAKWPQWFHAWLYQVISLIVRVHWLFIIFTAKQVGCFALQCVAMSAVYLYLWCSYLIATQLSVVTISFVVALSIGNCTL